MKTFKKVLFIVVFFAIAVSASAQFRLGVKAGFNASTIDGLKNAYESNVDVKYRPGFHVGLMAQYMMSENFGLETGLYYSTLGANGSIKGDEKFEAKLNPSYIQLPLSFLYKFNVGQNLYIYPSLGLYAGYGIGGKVKESAGTLSEEMDYFGKTDGEEWSNRFDMGATAGLNLQFEKIIIGLGYDYGLLKVNKEKATGNEKNLFNRNVKISLGYLF